MGQTAQFSVKAQYSDGSSADATKSVLWGSLDPNIATLSAGGLASPRQLGSTRVVATLLGVSGSASIDVTKAALTEISVSAPGSSLAVGLTAPLRASGTYTDKSVADITSQVAWSAARPDVVAVSNTGLAVAKSVGATQVTASLNGISASADISVSPAALTGLAVFSRDLTLPLGSTTQLSAVGTYTDGSNADLTTQAAWMSSSPEVIAIGGSGLATSKGVGATTVTATLAGLNASTNLSVSDAALVSLAVTASRSSLPMGGAGQLTATGTYTDGSVKDVTGAAVWMTSDARVISVSGGGAYLAKGIGSANVSATLAKVNGSTAIAATAAELVSLAVSSNASVVPLGASLQLTATGTFTDGSTKDLTDSAEWTSSSPEVVSVSSPGVATATALGSAVITATSGSFSADNELSVSSPALTTLSIAPAAPVTALGSSVQMAVTGIYSDGSKQDVSGQVSWTADDASVGSFSDGGVVHGLKPGTTGIHASLDGVSADDTLTVLPAMVVSYYDTASSADSTVRITNPAMTGQDLCALIYVFDQDQQLGECCGCLVSQNGLLTLSLKKNLLSNPLTGLPSAAGSVVVVPGLPASSGGCDASSPVPAGTLTAWSTRLPLSQSALTTSAEETFSTSPLNATDAAMLQAQCAFVQQLGSGQGLCGCGSGSF